MFSVDFHGRAYARAESTSPLMFAVGIQGIDSPDEAIRCAVKLKRIFDGFGVPLFYKSTSSGIQSDFVQCMEVSGTVRDHADIPVMVNVSEHDQLKKAVEIADVIILNNDVAGLNEILAENRTDEQAAYSRQRYV